MNQKVQPASVKIDIIYEDRILLIANKPDGVPSTEPVKVKVPNFFDQVKAFLQWRESKGGLHNKEVYLAIHHRLDQDTSGLLLFCKKKSFNKAVGDLFSDKKIQKTYLAVVKDSQQAFQNHRFPLQCHNYIGPAEKTSLSRMKMQCYSAPGPERQEAQTHFECLGTSKKDPTLHLIKAIPKTGRTHQIRVQLLSLGLPVLGDSFYADMTNPMYLHAWKLQFEHPESKQIVDATAPLPSSFGQLLDDYFAHLLPL